MTADFHIGKPFTNDVIVVDGLWGTGKSMLSSLIGTLAGVEKKRIDHIFEYLATGYSMEVISPSFASALIRIYTDLDQYNNLIGREVNLRRSDDSGFRNTPGSFRYLRRLVGGEGDLIVDKINQENLALLLVTHHLTGVSDHLYSSLGKRLHLIEVVRHPLQLVNYWETYFKNFERSREFTLCISVNGMRVPWFARHWAEEFIQMRPIDKAIRSIAQLQGFGISNGSNGMETSRAVRGHHLIVAFEHVLTNTYAVLAQVTHFLNRPLTPNTKRALRRQKLPRPLASRGRAVNKMNWLPNPRISYEQQLEEIMTSVKCRASIQSVELLETCIQGYGQHLLDLSTKLSLTD